MLTVITCSGFVYEFFVLYNADQGGSYWPEFVTFNESL